MEYKANPVRRGHVPRSFKKRQQRFWVILFLVLVLTSYFIIIHTKSAKAEDSQTSPLFKYDHAGVRVVREGETLWEIADEFTDGVDIRLVVAEIQRLNDCTADIYPEQALYVPVKR
ncbi:LysM peptidoglycan-binding domain-containing protein [Anaerosolibacter sp.]|uniref:LysM peptidoglycan-binding domain-containing protein n=1 Tax=Anaerosolibacter sp. TaxID=1872527 RepID=UPI0039EED5D7